MSVLILPFQRDNIFLSCDMSGNLEIGNGYGVPGGCAFYGASKPGIVTPGKNFLLLLDFYFDLQIGSFHSCHAFRK